MAEAIGLASGLLALATFAFQSSITLYDTVKSFRTHPTRVKELLDELQALSGVLTSLTETINATTDVDLGALDLPLLRCGNACKEFEQELLKCMSRSSDTRTSFRDWAKLRYMGDDIDGFRRVLSGYKLTINIALTDASLRKSSHTAESIEGYKDLLETTKADLEAHLENIDGKLELIVAQAAAVSESEHTSELQRMQEERLSTEKCLQICAQLSDHINQIQLTSRRGISTPGSTSDTLPERFINEGLEECKNSLALTATKLEKHMQDLLDRMLTKSRAAMTSEEEYADLARLKDEWETARQCMNICSKANNHLRENITNIENEGTGDTLQFMVSTDGKVIHGKNRGLGWRNRQVGGHLSDASVQQISRDMTSIYIQNIENERPSSRDSRHDVPEGWAENDASFKFREYGRGFKLSPKSSSELPTSSAASEGRASNPRKA